MESRKIDNVSCHARTLQNLIDRSTKIRINLPKDHTLFLAEVEKEDQVKSVKPVIVTSRIQEVIQEASIDTSIHRAHSLRAAIGTWAVMYGYNIDQVKNHAIGQTNQASSRNTTSIHLINFKKVNLSTIFFFCNRRTVPPHRNLKRRQQRLGHVCLPITQLPEWKVKMRWLPAIILLIGFLYSYFPNRNKI